MREKLHAYLLERPTGASPRELLDLIFTQPGADPELGPRFLRTFLSGDSRFAFRADTARWVATSHAALARSLRESSFVVVDLETTGGSPAQGDGIIEIGAVRLANGRVIGHFEQLVSPGRPLPRFITQLTGITDAMLARQPPVHDAIRQFLSFVGEDVLVAHNARFDLSFLNAAMRATLGRALHQQHFCTLRLARRLLPLARRRSLDALAGHLGIPVTDRHRALGDARMTAEVFLHFLERLAERGITQLDEALDFQYRAGDGRRFVCTLPRERVDQLPRSPGVYRFSGEGGRLLYIGKAKNLRQRVASYLSNTSGHSRKTLDLIRHICTVDVQQTGSELEAALREAEQIRTCKPPYNSLRKHLPRIAFLKLGAAASFPRLSIASQLSGGTARFFGPFRSRASAQRALDLLAQLFHLRTCSGELRSTPGAAECFRGQIGVCSAPCAARVNPTRYQQHVAGLIAFFNGEHGAIRAELERRREGHSAALRFEAAARGQRDIEVLEHLHRRQQRLAWVVARQHFLVLQPAVDRKCALLYAIVHGRLVERRTVTSSTDIGPLVARLRGCLADEHASRLRPEDVDGTTVIAAWMHERGERDGYVFPLDTSTPVEEQMPEWAAALRLLSSDSHSAASGTPQQMAPPSEQ